MTEVSARRARAHRWPPQHTHHHLRRRARRGQEAAFLSLYERHHAPAYRFALRLTGSVATAEDVVHDCFLDLVRVPAGEAAPGFDAARGDLRNYLYGMVRHRALKLFRSAGRECELEEAEGAPPRRAPPRAGESHEPLSHLLEEELAHEVRRAVAVLPPLQREALVLFEYEELSLAEVAEVVGADVGTVKARLFRARRSLRKTLSPYLSPRGAEALVLKD